jgi:integrase/recombinase XerD
MTLRRNLRSPKNKASLCPMARTVFESLLNQYLESLLVKGFTEATARTRRAQLTLFLEWLKERGIEEPLEVTRPVLERYQRSLFHRRKENGEPMSFRSQHGLLSAVRMWFKWMTRQNHILHNPASELELPKPGHRLPRHVLNIREVEQVLRQPEIGDPMGLRDRALLEVLYSTGMRRMEVASLKLYDLDFDGGTLLIRQGKGRKDRMVPIGERAVAWVLKYVREARPQLVSEPDDYTIFLTNAGESLALEWISMIVHDYVDKAQIGKAGSAHLFRHTMATLMLEGGADIRFIQQMLGHVSLRTTEKYTHVSIRTLQKVYAATHPGANLQRRKPASQDAEGDATRAELLAALDAEVQAGDDDPDDGQSR